jgi:hypothetical protein
MNLADFDRHVTERSIPEDELPQAFAAWLSEQTGREHPMRPASDEDAVAATMPEHPVFEALARVIRRQAAKPPQSIKAPGEETPER